MRSGLMMRSGSITRSGLVTASLAALLVAGAACKDDKKNIGDSCSSNSDCADEICHSGICVSRNPLKNGQPCQNDGYCLSLSCTSGTCVQNSQIAGTVCLNGEECASGSCVSGFCGGAGIPDAGAADSATIKQDRGTKVYLDKGTTNADAAAVAPDAASVAPDAGALWPDAPQTGSCGNGTKEAGEACDGTDHGGATCQSLGYAGGYLVCAGDCKSFITSNCVAASCTDGSQNGQETDTDCGGPSCPPCAAGKSCLKGTDCLSGVCTSNICSGGAFADGGTIMSDI